MRKPLAPRKPWAPYTYRRLSGSSSNLGAPLRRSSTTRSQRTRRRRSTAWPDVKKHRLLLSDAFDLTCGRQLKHAQLCKQLAKWTSTHASTVAAFESLFLYQDVPHRGRLQGPITKERVRETGSGFPKLKAKGAQLNKPRLGRQKRAGGLGRQKTWLLLK